MPFAGEPFAGEMSGPGNTVRTGFAGQPFAGEPFAGQTAGALEDPPEGTTWRWTGVAPVAPAAPVKERYAPRKERADGVRER